jgi:anthranilate phosphoribosyltransferase
MIAAAIAKLVDRKPLSAEEAYASVRDIMTGQATEAQIAGFLVALRLTGESAEVIAGAARAMREMFTPVQTRRTDVVDTCGTGGDGAHTFNISTTAAFIAAGAGVTVAKHGNRSVSSRCGSADVLAALGVKIDVAPEIMAACLDELGIAFLFAPALHPAMKHAAGPRKQLGVRTLFNILGPLTNPAGARRGVLGVYAGDLAPMMAEAAASLGAQRLLVVHGEDGLDELSTTAPSKIAEIWDGNLRVYRFDPQEQAGLPRASADALKGGDAEENARITRAILEGEKGPRRDIAALNAAAAILAADQADDWREAVTLAKRAIDSGAARTKMEDLVRRTREE